MLTVRAFKAVILGSSSSTPSIDRPSPRRKSWNSRSSRDSDLPPQQSPYSEIPRLPYKIHYRILTYLPLKSLISAMKVNQSYERACRDIILKRFLALPALHFASARRTFDETGGVYGFEGLGRCDPHQYILEEDYPLEFRVMNTFFITKWAIPDSAFEEMIACGQYLKAFAITVGDRSRWVTVFNLDVLKRRKKMNGSKALGVPSILERWYLDRPGHPQKGDYSNQKDRSKLVYVPETDNWYFTWPLSALLAFGVMDVY
jgi:hypothetical protein